MAQLETGDDALRFSTSCAKWAEYPKNLLYTSEFEHELDSYQAALNDDTINLFHANPTTRVLHMWSMREEGQGKFDVKRQYGACTKQLTLTITDHILTPNMKTAEDIQQITTLETSSPLEKYM